MTLSSRAKEISAFITPSGLYFQKVIPLGLQNASATFQWPINMVVEGLSGFAFYLDNVVFSDT